MNKTINIAKDFSDTPSGRLLSDGDFSGQRFRDDYVAPALRKYDHVDVVFDALEGAGSSFLEEAFGGLGRECRFEKSFLDSRLFLVATSRVGTRYKKLAEHFIAKSYGLEGNDSMSVTIK